MERKFKNTSGKTQVFYRQSPLNEKFSDVLTFTVEADETIEGDYWERYAGPNGPLQELLHSKSSSPSAPAV
jgi:hypothetical protein